MLFPALLLSACGSPKQQAQVAETTEAAGTIEIIETTEITEIMENAEIKETAEDEDTVEALYLGVENYGAKEVNKDTKDNFSYRFEINGKEEILKINNGSMNLEGAYDYPIQNRLKEGYSYQLQIEEGTVMEVTEKEKAGTENYKPPVSGISGERTVKNFLATAFMPVGTTLYVYGGGWDWQDVGSAIQARTIGVSEDWIKFFQEQDENYTYRDEDAANSYYPYGGYNEYYYAGLDCSGYVGWTLYNVMNTESGKEGYVMASTKMAKALAENGWGEWTQKIDKPTDHDFLPGDVFSIKGHVWICVGTCEDGSILILHSTPAASRTGQPGGGPELSAIGPDKDCEAYRLADKYMSEYYPKWYERYPVVLKDYAQYTAIDGEYTGKFSWDLTEDGTGLSDPDDYRSMTPEEVLKDLFQSSLPTKTI